jgi:7,8-dihydro-6-hydroxymethylpterin dimethyltransferase
MLFETLAYIVGFQIYRRLRKMYGDPVFRVLIVQFLDAYSFDVRSVKKSCTHIVHPDGRLIPFDTFNLFYRDQLETERLIPLRRNREAATYVG